MANAVARWSSSAARQRRRARAVARAMSRDASNKARLDRRPRHRRRPRRRDGVRIARAARLRVLVLERQKFPRFSIGESLLAYTRSSSRKPGCSSRCCPGIPVQERRDIRARRPTSGFNFADKSPPGSDSRSRCSARSSTRCSRRRLRAGAKIRFEVEITAVDVAATSRGEESRGGRRRSKSTAAVRARRIGLRPHVAETARSPSPSDFPARAAMFSHVQDNIVAGDSTGRRSARASTPTTRDLVLADSVLERQASVGVVAPAKHHRARTGTMEEQYWQAIGEEPRLRELLRQAEIVRPVGRDHRLRRERDEPARPALRAARQRRGIPRPGLLVGRHDRNEVGDPRGRRARPAAPG